MTDIFQDTGVDVETVLEQLVVLGALEVGDKIGREAGIIVIYRNTWGDTAHRVLSNESRATTRSILTDLKTQALLMLQHENAETRARVREAVRAALKGVAKLRQTYDQCTPTRAFLQVLGDTLHRASEGLTPAVPNSCAAPMVRRCNSGENMSSDVTNGR